MQEEELTGAADWQVAAAARRESRMLLTLDRGFGDVRLYPPGSHPGIMVLRPIVQTAQNAEALLRTTLIGHDLRDLQGCVVVVEPGRLRVRRPDR